MQVAGVAQVHSHVEEARVEASRLLHVTLGNVVIHLEQTYGRWCACHHEVAQVLRQAVDKEERVKSIVAYFLVDEQCLWHVAGEEGLVETEVVVVVEHIEVVDGSLIGDVAIAGCKHLVENRERVAHGTVGLLCDDVEGGRLGGDALVLADALQLFDNVGHGDACKVINLATRQDGGNNLLLLGGGEDEDSILGRFLKSFQERVECRLR